MKRLKQMVWMTALASVVLATSALAGESKANRGRSGERYRNRDPHGPHDGMEHRKGQYDQGCHRGGQKAERPHDPKGRAGHCRDRARPGGGGQRGLCRGERRRPGHMDPAKRDELMKRFREKFEDLNPDKPWGGRKREAARRPGRRLWQRLHARAHREEVDPRKRQELRKRFSERRKNIETQKGEKGKDRTRQHWDRGLHRGEDTDKRKGGGGFGRDRQKWEDYDGKPGKGNQNPGGPKDQ